MSTTTTIATALRSLQGAHLLERDVHNNVVVAWQYPSCTPVLSAAMTARWVPQLLCNTDGVFVSRLGHQWLYNATVHIQPVLELTKEAVEAAESSAGSVEPKPELVERFPKVAAVAVVLVSDVFDEEMFNTFAKLLLDMYIQNGSPLYVLQCYLSVYGKGFCDKGGERIFCTSDHEGKQPLINAKAMSLKDLSSLFGEEIILLYCALMMKKRVVVYSPSLQELSSVIYALPRLVSHRAEGWYNRYLWPLVTGSPEEVSDVEKAGVFCAGFVDRDVVDAHSDMYDVLVDIPGQTVTVTPAVLEQFALTKMHKEIMLYLTSESTESTEELEKGLAERTKGILEKLEGLKVNGFVTMDSIHEVGKVSAPLDRFLLSVAQAEDMTQHAESTEGATEDE